MTIQILHGDCREVLRTLLDESVHCVVTSPPYFGLRDYGVAGQIGLEPTPSAFVDEMVAVFRDVRRVLRADGTLWLNLGDSYSGSGPSGASYQSATTKAREGKSRDGAFAVSKTLSARGLSYAEKKPIPAVGTKAKDLIGVPWLTAFALRADGWYLRQDIIWSKPNPMPESVTDRCTKAHEYLFMLSKSARYHYDADAIAEDAIYSGLAKQDASGFKDPRSFEGKHKEGYRTPPRASGDVYTAKAYSHPQSAPRGSKANFGDYAKRNKRSVWSIPTAPYAEAHFATFPPALIEPCILAGCPKGGTVLDPFGGAGTTGLVADRLGRDAILIELNPEYAAMAERRIQNDAGMFSEVICTKAQCGPEITEQFQIQRPSTP
jgi:DNA modification methylase